MSLDTTVFIWFFRQLNTIWNVLFDCVVFGLPLGTLLIGFICLSIIITVFWRGAQG